MKHTFRRISSLLLAIVMILSLSVTAFAADSTITFKGPHKGFDFQPGSEYTATDLFDNFKDVMPGDKLTETIQIKNNNNDSDYIKIYMRAVAHDENSNRLSYSETFENTDGKDQANMDGQRDETVATMQDFLAQLTMRIYNGEQMIYEASPDQAGALTYNMPLGDLRFGEELTLTAELEVPLELGNEYANCVGEVDWVFLVEGFDDPVTEEVPDTPGLPPLIQTGQLNWPILVLIGLGLVLIVVGLVFLAKRKEDHA